MYRIRRFLSLVSPLLLTLALGCSQVASTPSTSNSSSSELTAEVVAFPSGGVTLHGYLYKPAGGTSPYPAIIYNHGSEENPTIHEVENLAKLYVAQGFVLFAPHRTGHGLSADAGPSIGDRTASLKAEGLSPSEMLAGVEGLHEEANADVVAAIQWLKTQSFVDPDRLVVSGISYGGIQTVLTAANSVEKGLGIRCAIPFAPGAMSWGPDFGDWLTSWVQKPTVPMFLIQAENDYSIEPSKVMGPIIESKGAPNRYNIYPPFGTTNAEGHGGFATFEAGTEIWGPDVLAFLKDCGVL
ncbi:MAG TPA: prolyl oligopeptidase family serine peptidase [bacterium]|nr:prolyl oligopeptidase family serine peptidase [bacterium]